MWENRGTNWVMAEPIDLSYINRKNEFMEDELNFATELKETQAHKNIM